MPKSSTIAAACLALSLPLVTCAIPASVEDTTTDQPAPFVSSVEAQAAASGIPANAKELQDASKDFLKYYETWLEKRLEKWKGDVIKATRDQIVMPPMIYANDPRSGARTWYAIVGVSSKGLSGQRLLTAPGHGDLLLGKAELLKLREMSDDSLLEIFPDLYAAKNSQAAIVTATQFACFLYDNKCEWAGNRAMRRVYDMSSRDRTKQDLIADFIRRQHGWEGVELATVDGGAGKNASLKRQELVPAPKSEDEAYTDKYKDVIQTRRLELWQEWAKQELAYWCGEVKRNEDVAKSLTWKIVNADKTDPKYAMWRYSDLKRQLDEVLERVDGSDALTQHQTAYADLDQIKKKRDREAAEQANILYWQKLVNDRVAEIDNILKQFESHYSEGAKLRKDDPRKAYEYYEKAELELRKLIPQRKQGGGLDPAQGFWYYKMGETLLYSCKPVEREVDVVDDSAKAYEAIEMNKMALRYFPEHEAARHHLARAYLYTKQYKNAREIWEKLKEDKGSYQKTAETWLETLDRVESNRGKAKRANER